MSIVRKYAAIAALGVGLALAVALPASAQWWGGPSYGYVRWPAPYGCCGYGYSTYHPWGYAGYYRPYYFVFYHRPYYASVDGYYPRHHYFGHYHRPYYGYYHRRYHRHGYGYARAYHRANLWGRGYGAYRR
jgi:hypothetical protein